MKAYPYFVKACLNVYKYHIVMIGSFHLAKWSAKRSEIQGSRRFYGDSISICPYVQCIVARGDFWQILEPRRAVHCHKTVVEVAGTVVVGEVLHSKGAGGPAENWPQTMGEVTSLLQGINKDNMETGMNDSGVQSYLKKIL
jgi:hypothetical protein